MCLLSSRISGPRSWKVPRSLEKLICPSTAIPGLNSLLKRREKGRGSRSKKEIMDIRVAVEEDPARDKVVARPVVDSKAAASMAVAVSVLPANDCRSKGIPADVMPVVRAKVVMAADRDM